MKKMMSLVLVLCLLVGMTCPAFAAMNNPDGIQASEYFASYGISIGDNGGHRMHITFSTTGVGVCDEIGVASYTVDKQITGDDGHKYWTTVAGPVAGQTSHNTSFCTFGANFQGIAGETYRVRATFYCAKTFPDGTSGAEFKYSSTGPLTIN